jgi:hypothetical protein
MAVLSQSNPATARSVICGGPDGMNVVAALVSPDMSYSGS